MPALINPKTQKEIKRNPTRNVNAAQQKPYSVLDNLLTQFKQTVE